MYRNNTQQYKHTHTQERWKWSVTTQAQKSATWNYNMLARMTDLRQPHIGRISIRRRVSLTTGFLTRSIYTLRAKVVFDFFNSVNLLEFSILDLHDCIYWSFSLCFSTTWKLLLTPGGSNQIFLKPFSVRQLWFSMQTVSKVAFNSTLAVLWTSRSQYFTAIVHILFIIGNLPSSSRAAILLEYLLTFYILTFINIITPLWKSNRNLF